MMNGPRTQSRQRSPAPDDEALARWTDEGGSQSAYHDPHATGDLRAMQQGRRAGFRGRGPKGYVRSDERLHETVCELLTDAPDVDASDVSVRCEQGTVTLEGSVPSRWMKHRIDDLVDACLGATEVHNHLRVVRTDRGAGADGRRPDTQRR